MQTPVWAPLKPSTLKEKKRKGYSSTPLIRTGHYRQSFRSFYDNDGAGVGSEVPYSKYHETGTQHLPARPALPPRDVALDFAVKIYDRWVAGIAREAR
jgi:phage gpG-like protein